MYCRRECNKHKQRLGQRLLRQHKLIGSQNTPHEGVEKESKSVSELIYWIFTEVFIVVLQSLHWTVSMSCLCEPSFTNTVLSLLAVA